MEVDNSETRSRALDINLSFTIYFDWKKGIRCSASVWLIQSCNTLSEIIIMINMPSKTFFKYYFFKFKIPTAVQKYFRLHTVSKYYLKSSYETYLMWSGFFLQMIFYDNPHNWHLYLAMLFASVSSQFRDDFIISVDKELHRRHNEYFSSTIIEVIMWKGHVRNLEICMPNEFFTRKKILKLTLSRPWGAAAPHRL